MAAKKKSIPAKIQGSEVVRVRLNPERYEHLVAVAKRERRKITNLVQVLIEEGLEARP